LKYGFDLHGVLDTYPEIYAPLTGALIKAGHEVHIITGHQETAELTAQLAFPEGRIGIKWTHWFSIVDYHIEQADHKVRFEGDQPWMEDDAWNRTKAEYCERVGIDLMFDDSPKYGSYFTGKTVFLLQKNQGNQEAWLRLAGRI
jgi:hypothetical protein